MKTKRYKNGDYRAYKYWTNTQWAGLSERDKAMWTEYSDDEPAAISKEVLEFTEKNDLDKPCCKEVNECVELRAKVAELEAEILALKGTPTEPEVVDDEEAEKELIKARLTELEVPFRSNTGLKKLREKLELAEDANNTE